MMDVSALPLLAETSTDWTCPQQRLGVVGQTGREIIGNDLSPREGVIWQPVTTRTFLPSCSALFQPSWQEESPFFFVEVGWGEGVSLPPFLFGFQ